MVNSVGAAWVRPVRGIISAIIRDRDLLGRSAAISDLPAARATSVQAVRQATPGRADFPPRDAVAFDPPREPINFRQARRVASAPRAPLPLFHQGVAASNGDQIQ